MNAARLGLLLWGLAACTGPSSPRVATPDPLIDRSQLGTLGAIIEPSGDIRFRLFSANATRVVLHLFAKPSGADEAFERVLDREPGRDVWSTRVTLDELSAHGLAGVQVYYGYRLWGPNWPYVDAWTKGSEAGFISDVDAKGHRFNPNKLLLDPYAKEVSHDPLYPAHLDFRSYRSGPEFRSRDNGRVAPKGLVLPPGDGALGARPRRALKDDVVYEVHVRGLTRNDPRLLTPCPGTYKAAALKADHLKSLGVTAIELLPIQETQNDINDVTPDASGDNYWGYSTLAFFAPDRRYACDQSPGGPTREFRDMVKAFHARDIKVFIDVVYNHTGEGNPDKTGDSAALLSFRGLDNASYYQLKKDGRGYRNDNGVSGNMNAVNPAVRALILDSLRYWVEDMGVDGFRFDLASLLGNRCTDDCFKYERDGGLLERIALELPARTESEEGVDLIAEPWGVTEGTYQLGNFPKGWSEWNGQFRDTVRRQQNKLTIEHVSPRTLLSRWMGSVDLSKDRRPWNSVNYVVSHDGFTLHDLYRCPEKRNDQPWPFGPSDGGDNYNLSWDQGGDAALQRQAARTGLALLMLSAGVPMLTGGDEMLRTQHCNNNAYNLDSNANWLDWNALSANARFHEFTQRLIAFRHAHPVFRPAKRYASGDGNGNGFKPVTVLTPSGAEADNGYLDNAGNTFVALHYEGSEFQDSAPWLYVAYNGGGAPLSAQLPQPSPGRAWHRVADTAAWMESASNFARAGEEARVNETSYTLHPRSILILVEK